MKSKAKAVVIGGGVVGASTLYHLASKGWNDSILLERKMLTSGSTWHAAGLLPLFNMSYSVGQIPKYSVKFYQQLQDETKMDVGESFSITDVYSTLNAVPNLADTISVKVTLASGTGYSTTNLNIKSQTTPDGRYIRAPKNVIFEVKYPNVDIQGTMK